MFATLLTLLLTSTVAADNGPAAGTQLNYRGALELSAGDPAGRSRKSFDLTLWVAKTDGSGADLYWMLEERGHGEWPWTERLGRIKVDGDWRATAGAPALLYDRGDGRSVVPLRLPFLTSETPLAADAKWQEDKTEYHVEKGAKRADRQVWQVAVQDGYGPRRTLWVDQEGPLVVSMNERLTMGRGDEYRLTLEYVSSESLPAERLEAIRQVCDSLAGLRNKLALPPHAQEIHWKSDQMALLKPELAKVRQRAEGTPLERLLSVAARDVDFQAGRSDAVTELRAKHVGQAVEKFAIKGFGSDALADEDLIDKITVLHFWDYRDEPLKEPYGQVGYLDYTFHRRKAAGVRVYGVAVDGRLGDAKTRGAAERGVKKLKSFMNLSYPILLDTGSLIKQFGDPRVLGADLPLFVVIGPDGKILHYHVGAYDVHQDQGLKELDQAIAGALAAQK